MVDRRCSSAIVFGLSFATVLTLIVTPSMLMVFTRSKNSKVYGFFRRSYGGAARRWQRPLRPRSRPVAARNTSFPKAAE